MSEIGEGGTVSPENIPDEKFRSVKDEVSIRGTLDPRISLK